MPDGDGSSDKADWKSVVVTWSGRRLYPLHWMKRLLLKRSIIPRTSTALSLRTLQRSSLCEISKRWCKPLYLYFTFSELREGDRYPKVNTPLGCDWWILVISHPLLAATETDQ